ncbi:MAG: hypothetical protein JWO11_49 [Nocardioides sp.]|jgi:hypothetical protein|nr:hypothetical protein [Nocardioides sp.]
MGTFFGVTAPTSRSSLVGAALGLVVLGLLVAFAVALPNSSGESSHAAAAASAPITLPETLPGQWTAVDVVSKNAADPAAAAKFAKDQEAAVAYVSGVLADVYGDEPTAFRAYANDNLSAFVTLSVFDAPGGAFAPNGFADPKRVGLARAQVELVRVGAAVCQSTWQTIAAGQQVPANEVPLGTSCQLSSGGRTYQMGTQGMSVESTVKLLEQAVGATS